MFKFYSDYSDVAIEGCLVKGNYTNNNNLYIGVMSKAEDGDYFEPWCSLTTNIIDLPEYTVAIDLNNMHSNIYDVLIDMDVLIPTGQELRSGFCTYPVCKVTDKLYDLLMPQDDGVV